MVGIDDGSLQADSQPKLVWLGLRNCLNDSTVKLGELLRWLCLNDSTVNIGISIVSIIFTPLRYVPNVAKRSIWINGSKYILTTDRPATDRRLTSDRPLISKISNGHISTTGRPIHFMFGSRVGFSGTADLMALFPVRTNPRWWPSPSWKNFKWPYLRNRSSDSLHVWF